MCNLPLSASYHWRPLTRQEDRFEISARRGRARSRWLLICLFEAVDLHQRSDLLLAVIDQTQAGALSTRERLKANARQLVAQKGVAVTVREILAAANERNGASLNYYFGSKDDLLREIFRDASGPLQNRWGELLSDLEQTSSKITVRDLITLIVDGWRQVNAKADFNCARYSEKLIQQRPDLVAEVLREQRYSAYANILRRLRSLLPGLPKQVIRERLTFLNRYLSTLFALHEEAVIAARTPGLRSLRPVTDLGNVIDTAVGLVCAPLVDGPKDVAEPHAASIPS